MRVSEGFIETTRRGGVDPVGVILNRATPGKPALSEADNPGMIRSFGKTKVWGPVENSKKAAGKEGHQIKIESLPNLEDVARDILKALR